MASLDAVVHSESVNAAVGWAAVGVVAFVVLESAASDAPLWAVFAAAVLAVALWPPVTSRDWSVMAPWPLLVVAAVAVLLGGFGVRPEAAGYVAVAALALLTAVELDAFTEVEMSRRFAVAFAVLTTLAVQGLWTITQFYADRWLGTDFLTTQRELQVDIVTVSLVGLVMGVAFEWYFARVEHVGSYRRPQSTSRDR